MTLRKAAFALALPAALIATAMLASAASSSPAKVG
jgi:hypothetical protein